MILLAIGIILSIVYLRFVKHEVASDRHGSYRVLSNDFILWEEEVNDHNIYR